ARVLPAVRSRAEGISRAATLPEKLGRWCELTGVEANPLMDSLAMLETLDAQSIADRVLAGLADDPVPPASGLSPPEPVLPPVLAALVGMELEDDVGALPVPPVSRKETDAKPALPSSAATAPAMDWLTDDLFA
ncbi:MAG: metallophosphatase family protein, partial [Longimicrobiales bacterium]